MRSNKVQSHSKGIVQCKSQEVHLSVSDSDDDEMVTWFRRCVIHHI